MPHTGENAKQPDQPSTPAENNAAPGRLGQGKQQEPQDSQGSHHESLVRLYELEISTLQELFDFALEEAIVLTRSSIGYILFYNEQTQIFTLYSWSRSVMRQCAVVEKPDHFHLNQAGIWGEVVRQRQPLIINDFPRQDPQRKGYPKGHVSVRNFLSIPVWHGDAIIAVIAVGNKPGDYTQLDVTQLDLFAKGVWGIARRKEAEESLKESTLRLQLALEGSGDGVWDWDILNKQIYFSARCKAILGYDAQELGNDPEEWKLMIHPDELEGLIENLYGHLSGDSSVFTYEHRARCKNGSYKWLLSRGKVLQRDTEDSPLRVIGTMTDITERKRMEALKDDVDKIIKHDLRSHFIGIVGLPEIVLQNKLLSCCERDILRAIQESGYKILSILDNSIDIFKMELGTYTLTLAKEDLVQLALKTIGTTNQQFRNKNLNYSFTIDKHEATRNESFFIYCEASLCSNMLSNLLINAAEASPAGETIHLTITTPTSAFSIANKGAVPPEIRQTFFEKYVTAGKSKGTGLGTYSAALIAKTHGWKLLADTSIPGETTVTLTFGA